MRMLPRSLGGQLVVLLLAALVVSQAVAFLIFSDERRQAVRMVHQLDILERTAAMVRVLEATPPALRDEILVAVDSPRLRFWISRESALPESDDGAHARTMAATLSGMLAAPPREPVRVGLTGDGEGFGFRWARRGVREAMREHHEEMADSQPGPRGAGRYTGPRFGLTISAPLSDGGWLNVATRIRPPAVAWAWPALVSMLLAVAATLLVVALTVRRITRPLTALSGAAERLGRGEEVAALDETGPAELRRTTAAFNAMQKRLTRFVRDRTAMLAAIGHDLRTPITALRLRAELVEDEEARERLLAIIAEMQQMTEATLAFAREEAQREETRPVDLSALVGSLCDDLTEMGRDVAFSGPDRLVNACRPVALRRALRNLIDNAVSYGRRARVTLAGAADGVTVTIDDDGPGIPEADLERVFGPFVRLEGSRSRETGGVGLGMAIARSIVRAHGGDITLANRPEGGLRATVSLPAGGSDRQHGR